MQTFSCAVQDVEAGDTRLRFEVDREDSAICRLVTDKEVLLFQRNGRFLGVEPREAERPEAVEEDPAPERRARTWGRRRDAEDEG